MSRLKSNSVSSSNRKRKKSERKTVVPQHLHSFTQNGNSFATSDAQQLLHDEDERHNFDEAFDADDDNDDDEDDEDEVRDRELELAARSAGMLDDTSLEGLNEGDLTRVCASLLGRALRNLQSSVYATAGGSEEDREQTMLAELNA